MASLLESLAQGLRGAGGVMSGDVHRSQLQEERDRAQLMMQERERALQEAQFNMQLEELQRRRAHEERIAREVAPLLTGESPDLTRAGAAAAAIPGGFQTGVSLIGKAEDRAARLQQQQALLQQKRDEISARLQEAAARRASQEEIARIQIQGRREIAELVSSLRQPPAPSIVEIQDPNDPSKNIKIDARTREVIGTAPTKKGDEGGVAGETAGKIAMADQAMVDIRSARSRIFDKDGGLNRVTVAAMNAPFTAGLPGHTDARSAYSELYNAVAAKLRIETGAAATESEVKGILDRFMPSVSDTAKSAQDKLDRLEAFMSGTLDQIKGVRKDKLRSNIPPPPPGYEVQ